MKKSVFRNIFIAISAAVLLSANVNADFAKTKTYTDGTFTDVPVSEWYAQSVKDAYEFGIMNGNSATTFNPTGTLTVAEGITIAARLNETISGIAIEAVSGGEWYKQYVDYCVNQGIFASDKFDSYTRNIRRSEMAELMAAVSGKLPDVNTVSKLPDVPYDAEYADSVFKLYRGGILTGNDDSGTFAPESELKRSEISAMAVRIADSTKRVSKAFSESTVRAYYDAYTIIETMSGSGSDNGIANGWNYDFRFNVLNQDGKFLHYIADSSDEIFGSLKRDFNPEKAGVLILDTYVTVKSKNGCAYIAFKDNTLGDVVSVEEKDGKFALIGTTTVVSGIAFPDKANTEYALTMTIDLDKNTATAYINNALVGTVGIADCEISRLELGCRKTGTGYIELGQMYLTKNYSVNDKFFATAENVGEKPASWEVSGNFAIGKTNSMLGTDKFSIKADSKAENASVATKSFEAIAGKVLFETNILLPDKIDGASAALACGGNEVLKIETKNGKFVIGDTVLHDYIPNVWQSLYVEADTRTGTALIKINGKKRATVPFAGTYFDGIKMAFNPNKDAVMWFDDVQVSNVISHADYPSYPKVAESADYNVGVNVCWLWRDSQSREGWDATSPFEEFDTYMGYYDEGIKETADWELKWMAEHGIDFIHACWYAPDYDIKEPFKQMRISHEALHDGYMNAEYSDLVDFCIMWEVGFKGCTSAENFKNYIWPYWKEYYFADDRYVRLDNKALLTIWSPSSFDEMLGGKESAIEVVKFMDSELKEMGYDGLMLWFTTQSVKDVASFNSMKEYGVEIATYAYHWHKAGDKPSVQIDNNKLYRGYAEKADAHHVPTVSVGFNDVGRNDSRSPLITGEDHLTVCNDIKKTLSEYSTGTWRDNTVMISTWNEFSEGTYVLPTNSHGFAYLENVRKVFTNDASDHTALDVKLTPSQMKRVGRTYPPNHNPLRWLQLNENTVEDGNSVSTNPDDLTVIQSFNLASDIKVSHNIGVLAQKADNFTGHAQATDFGLVTSQTNQISAKQCPVLHIRMKTTETGTGEIFFVTDIDKSWDGAKSKTFALKGAGEFHDYYINMSETALWNSTITRIRLDPNDRVCDFEITCFEILGDSSFIPIKTAKLVINAQKIDLTYPPSFTNDGDIEIIAEERNRGFFSMMGLYHEFDRYTSGGVLKVYTKEGTELVFTQGSDKITVNGKAEDLGYTFRFRNGLPVLRLKKLLSYTGYNYSIDGDTVNIQACNDEDYKTLTNRRPDAFEFNIEGDKEGFTCLHTELTQGGGRLMGAASTTGTADPQITRSVTIDANKYSGCTVGMLYSEALINPKTPPQLFFSQSGGFSGSKVVDGTYDLTGKKEGDIVEIHFDLRSHEKYTGTITKIRFDPFSAFLPFEIDYIRFIEGSVLDDIALRYEKAVSLDLSKVSTGNFSPSKVTAEAFEGTSVNNDPLINIRFEPFAAESYPAIRIRMKASKEGYAQLFFATDKSSGISENKSFKIALAASDEVQDYYILTGDNSNWKDTINYLRFDPVSTPETSFVIEAVDFLIKKGGTIPENTAPAAPVVEDYSLKYEKAASLDFTKFSTGNFSPSKASAEVFEGTSVNSDPLINVKFEPFAAESYPAIRIRMKSSKDGFAQIFFATDKSSGISEDKSFKVNIPASDEVKDYYIITGNNSNWKDTITYLRFDPVNTAETSFVIEAVDFMVEK